MSSQATGNLRTTVAANIKAARDAAGLTQKELGQLLESDPQFISKWERGEHTPSIKNLSALAIALKVDVAWFYTDHEREAAA